jgi:vacuolar-type H+-ATPase subunit F/Vma7
MSRVVVVGEPPRVDGWALSGAVVVPVTDAEDARRGADALADDVEVVITTPTALRLLGDRLAGRLVVLLP